MLLAGRLIDLAGKRVCIVLKRGIVRIRAGRLARNCQAVLELAVRFELPGLCQ